MSDKKDLIWSIKADLMKAINAVFVDYGLEDNCISETVTTGFTLDVCVDKVPKMIKHEEIFPREQ